MLEEDKVLEIWRQEILFRTTYVLTLSSAPPSMDVALFGDRLRFKS